VLLIMSAILAVHLFGMRMFELTKAKIGASDDARNAIGKLVGEIRAAKIIRVGEGSINSFAEAGFNAPQVGGAIQIHTSTNTNSFVRYYIDPDERVLKRVTNNGGTFTVVANAISNVLVFSSEDFAGNILTNNQNNRVIGLNLQFYQLQHPPVRIGEGSYYDFYQLRTKITRRTLE